MFIAAYKKTSFVARNSFSNKKTQKVREALGDCRSRKCMQPADLDDWDRRLQAYTVMAYMIRARRCGRLGPEAAGMCA